MTRIFDNAFTEDQPAFVYAYTDADKQAEASAEAAKEGWGFFAAHTVLASIVEVQPATWEEFGLSNQQNPSIAI